MYIQYSEFSAHSVFQGKHKLLKSPESSKIFQHSEKFQGNSVFQGKKVVQKSEWSKISAGEAKKGVHPYHNHEMYKTN